MIEINLCYIEIFINVLLSFFVFIHFCGCIYSSLFFPSYSVERSKYYTDELPREADYSRAIDNEPKLQQWPSEGQIQFKNVSMQYRPGLPLVLDQVNAIIKSGEKVGIVGRTGAGKSSLMIALFRLVEICGGEILVDDVDIKTLGLQRLRSKMVRNSLWCSVYFCAYFIVPYCLYFCCF